MTEKSEVKDFPLRINTDLCGNCVFCISVCPFEALSQIPETKKIKIDTDKCRLCGICYATCPSRLIEIEYYNTELLTEYVRKRVAEESAEKVVIACHGTALTPSNWQSKIAHNKTDKTIFFALPCLGRIHMSFLLNVADSGAQKISLITCQHEFCRYKKGSEVMSNRYSAAQAVFEDMGYSPDMIELQIRVSKATINEMLCTGCQMCINSCPYKAIELKDIRNRQGQLIRQVAKVNESLCHGCGVCVATCPSKCPDLVEITEEQVYTEILSLA